MLQGVIDAVPAMINAKDHRYRYVFMNRYQADCYDVSPDNAIGKTASELVGTDHGTHTEAIDAEVFSTNKAKSNYEETWVDKNGVSHTLLTNKVPLKDESAAASHVVSVALDISERRQAEEDRRLALVDAEQANQAKSEFLATMSHEFRTPLNAILGFADILSHQYFGPPGEGKYREYAHDIHASGEHLLTLVNEILDLSAIEAGKQSLVKEKLSTEEVVKECKRIVENKARSSGIDLVTEVPKDLPPLYADKRASRQILLNLLSNAVKFTPEGGKVTVSVKTSKRETTLKIADTGKGIPAEKLPKLTDPFTREDTDPYLAEEGWGLGLTITKSLVELHDGTLDIKSKVGEGTTVTVMLPNGVA